MRKVLPILLFVVMLAIGLVFFVVENIDPHRDVPIVTLDRLNQNETDWYATGISSYRVLVLASFGDQQRRYEIEVSDFILTGARSAQLDEDSRSWSEMLSVPEEEASFFTIPGMYGMLRKDLVNQQVEREVMRIETDPAYFFPTLIYLGNLIVEGEVQEDTALTIEVLDFEILSR